MPNLTILRNDGGSPIVVPAEATELEINEPVSALANLAEVIESLPRLERLTFYVKNYGMTDFTESLAFLHGAARLKELLLCSMPHLLDCAALIKCKSLESLSLTRHVTKTFDFSLLPSLASLRTLSVEMPTHAVLERVAKASQLTSLKALGGFKLDSLEPLSGLTDLSALKLWSGSLVSSRGLTAFGKLKELNLGHSKLRDTTQLGSLKGLRKMELAGNRSITSLEFLQPGDLEFLGMYDIPRLDSLKPLVRLSNLKEFYCEARILDDDLRPLVDIPTLEKAYLPGRYKSALKQIRAERACVFKVGGEKLKLTNTGPVILESAREAKKRLLKKLENIPIYRPGS